MKKITIDVSKLKSKNYLMKESFDFFAKTDLTNLKWNDPRCVSKYRFTKHQMINHLMFLRNVNPDHKSYVFVSDSGGFDCEAQNIVGYIDNISELDNKISFNLNFMRTVKGIEFSDKNNIGFDIIFRIDPIEIHTGGCNPFGLSMTTNPNTIRIMNMKINDTGIINLYKIDNLSLEQLSCEKEEN